MRLGFLGVGWIGRTRLATIAECGGSDIAMIVDPEPEHLRKAAEIAPRAKLGSAVEDLFTTELDGVVIATPNALHAQHVMLALEHGLPVFCQKPLGRTEAETRRLVEAAHIADRLLMVDLSYRYLASTRRVQALIQNGDLGDIFAADLVFHNAYGPDQAWYYDPRRSGGGCVVDLGIHLVDLALWMLAPCRVTGVMSRLFAGGVAVNAKNDQVEDYAVAQLDLDRGGVVRIACSWNISAGCDAVIQASFCGTRGGASLHNVNGSFYDFAAELYRGTTVEPVCSPPDSWGGRALLAWLRRLRRTPRFDPSVERLIEVAAILDAIYAARANKAAALCAS